MPIIICCWVIISSFIIGFSDADIKTAYSQSYRYEKMTNYDDAIKALYPLYNAFPQGYTLNLRLGYLHTLNKQYANAIEMYQKAIKIAPSALDAKLGYAYVLMIQEKFDQAEAVAIQIVNMDYYNYYGNFRLAYCLRQQGKLDLAQQVVVKMLAVYPIDGLFLAEYGKIKVSKKEVDAAKQLFQSVLILDPENVEAKAYLAQLK